MKRKYLLLPVFVGMMAALTPAQAQRTEKPPVTW